MIVNQSFIRSIAALLFIGLLALLVIVGMSIWLAEGAQHNLEEAIAARNARRAAVDLRHAVATAESSQRGFLLAGTEIYLAPYATAKRGSEDRLAELLQEYASRGDAGEAVQQLASILAEKFTEMDETIALKRAGRDADAMDLLRSNRGKALMDEANVFLSALIRDADDRLTRGFEEQGENAAWLRSASIVGGFVIILVVGGAAVAMVRYTRALAEARNEVTALNAGLEERVRARTADLARANDEIQRFAYIVTHDLRAPLVNIMGFTSELEASTQSLRAALDSADAGGSNDPTTQAARIAATEDLPEAIGFIRSSTRKMDSLINAILKLSREGHRTLRPERLDLSQLIRSSAEAIQHQVARAGGAIDVRLAVPPVLQDRLSLELIFGNLFDNAVKYRSTKRPLRIEVRGSAVAAGMVAIEISDNGRGIAEQDQERVFELFRRAGPQDQPGEGIGLPYARTVARKLGGDLSLTSRLDEGTVFRLILPRTLQVSERDAA